MSTSGSSESRLITLQHLSQSIADPSSDETPDRAPTTLYVLDDLPTNCFFYQEESLALVANRSVSIEFVSRTLDPVSGCSIDRTAHHEHLRIDENHRFESLAGSVDSSPPKSEPRSPPKEPASKLISTSLQSASSPLPSPSDRDQSNHPSTPPPPDQEDSSPCPTPSSPHPFLREGRIQSTNIDQPKSPSPKSLTPSDSPQPTRNTPLPSNSPPQTTQEASTDVQVARTRGIKRSAGLDDSIPIRRPPKTTRIQAKRRSPSIRLSQRKSNPSLQSDQEEATMSQKAVETVKSTQDQPDTGDDIQPSTQNSLLMSQECTRISRRVSRRLQLKRSFSQSQETPTSSQASP